MASNETIEFLSGVIRAAFKTEEDKPQIGVYRPSLLPCCLKRQFHIYKQGLIISEEKAGLFEIGRLFHDFLSRTFKDGGLTMKSVEAPFSIVFLFENEIIRISGRADLIITLNGEDYIIEVKSVKKLPKQPFKHHVEQVQLYLAGYGLTHAFLVYLEKSYLKNIIFSVDFNIEKFRKLVERAATLHKHLKGGDPPAPDGEPWECRYCEFKKDCGEEGPLITKLDNT